MIELLFILICVGILAGFLSGMFGLGGGLTIIPALVFCLPYFGFPEQHIMHAAVATSLSIMFINSIYGLYKHNKSSRINWEIVKLFSIFIISGALIGSFASSYLSNSVILIFFVIFLGYILIVKIKKTLRVKKSDSSPSHSIKIPLIAFYGSLTGVISALVGGGSSLMIVPFLEKRDFTIKEAVAICTTFNIFLAFTASVSYMYLGLLVNGLPNFTLGYIYLPAFFCIIAGSFIGVPIGVKTIRHLKNNFAALIYFAFVSFIFILMFYKMITYIG